MREILVWCLMVLGGSIFGQATLEIVEKKNGNFTMLQVKNNSVKESFTVKVNLDTKGFKLTPPPPYDISIRPGELVDIVTLIPKVGEEQGYEVSMSAKLLNERPSQADKLPLPTNVLMVFTMPNCGKCKVVLESLVKAGKTYQEVSLADDEKSKAFWANYATKATTVNTPVIYYNGEFTSNYSEILNKIK